MESFGHRKPHLGCSIFHLFQAIGFCLVFSSTVDFNFWFIPTLFCNTITGTRWKREQRNQLVTSGTVGWKWTNNPPLDFEGFAPCQGHLHITSFLLVNFEKNEIMRRWNMRTQTYLTPHRIKQPLQNGNWHATISILPLMLRRNSLYSSVSTHKKPHCTHFGLGKFMTMMVTTHWRL